MNAEVEVHSLAGAYALHALPESERELFRAHLRECTSCRQEVDEFAVTAARLGAEMATTAPPRMRRTVMSQVAQTRQWAPLPRAEDRQAVVPMRRRRKMRLLAAAAALVLVALAGGVGIGAWVLDEPAQERIAAVVTADDAQTEQARLEGGGTLTLISSAERGSAVVMADSLPELSPEQIYQLWVIEDAQARSADVFFDGSGQGQTHLIDELEPGVQIAITREPQGGSEEPTMEPLGVVALST